MVKGIEALLAEAVETYKEFCHEDIAASFEMRVRKVLSVSTVPTNLGGQNAERERRADQPGHDAQDPHRAEETREAQIAARSEGGPGERSDEAEIERVHAVTRSSNVTSVLAKIAESEYRHETSCSSRRQMPEHCDCDLAPYVGPWSSERLEHEPARATSEAPPAWVPMVGDHIRVKSSHHEHGGLRGTITALSDYSVHMRDADGDELSWDRSTVELDPDPCDGCERAKARSSAWDLRRPACPTHGTAIESRSNEAPNESPNRINPGARVYVRGTPSSRGTVDGWIGSSKVRVAWDSGHRSEVIASSLIVIRRGDETRTQEASPIEESELLRQLVRHYSTVRGEDRAVVESDFRRVIEWARNGPRTDKVQAEDAKHSPKTKA